MINTTGQSAADLRREARSLTRNLVLLSLHAVNTGTLNDTFARRRDLQGRIERLTRRAEQLESAARGGLSTGRER